MSYEAIVSDWNGTLYEYPTDEMQNKRLAYAILDDAKRELFKGKFWKTIDVLRLAKTKVELRKRLRQYYDGKRHLWEVYEPFNEKVLKGKLVEFVRSVIDSYAKENADRVDGKMVRPIQAVHQSGKYTGILSVSFDYSIKRILEEAGYRGVFNDIVSNTLLSDKGKAIGLTLGIYQKKPEVLHREFFSKRGLREDNTLYMGDSDDDAPIAEILIPGNFIIPFFASDEFKQRMASRHKSFVPESEEDLLRYLKVR